MVALIVGGAHVVAFWLIRDLHETPQTLVADFSGSILFFMPAAALPPHTQGTRSLAPRLQRRLDLSEELAELSSASLSDMPLPAASSAPIAPDWQQAIESVATDVIARAKQDAARSARIDSYPVSASFQPLHDRPRDFDWVSRHSHQVINAHGVPEWVLVEPCAIIIPIKDPDCTFAHVEQHGVFLEYTQQQHDAHLAYGGPNAIP
jgi:hypothetical protein